MIGNTALGRGRPPLVVAELSANHNASLERALRIVRAAADCGADAIKLQTFQPEALTLDSERPEFFIDDPGGPWHGRRLIDLYRQAHTPWPWHKPIFEAARASGLACISTACDLESLEFLLEQKVDAIKIASFESIHVPLLAAAARSSKPILLSTGMASAGELDQAVSTLRDNGCDRFILLKCTSAYPASESDANVLTMQDMRRRYECEVGLSDHSLGPYVCYAATALGAVVLEKHVTLCRADGGLDATFSAEPAELRDLVDGTKRVWRGLGTVRYGALPAEHASLRERPSIYVTQPVKKGETFTTRNTRIIRPASGLAPQHYERVVGKLSARDIAAGMPLTWNDVEGASDRGDKSES